MEAARHSLSKRPPLPAGPYLVAGLGRSGQAAAELLARRGERVVATDRATPEGAGRLSELGVEVVLDADGTALAEGAGCLVKSPGVPGDAPVVVAARERGVPVLGELELGWRLLPNRFVAVTGTNGKTTVTELLGHLWRVAGEPVAVAGNVGTALSSLPGTIGADATIVCEASSFQLEDTEAFAPDVAVLLNLEPDHLDRHGTFDAYADAKLRIFAHQPAAATAVVAEPEAARFRGRLGAAAQRRFCRAERPRCDATLARGAVWVGEERLVDAAELGLLGAHNALNATAAALVALEAGLGADAVREGLASFAGVAHRLERIATKSGVLYVNDSKATNVAAASVALDAFAGGVHLILGGSLKGESFVPLVRPVSEHCVACYLIGEAAGEIERDLAEAWAAGIEAVPCEGLEAAVVAASRAAAPGETVLLAPACASFDRYRDFEARGDHFRALVEELGPR